MTEIKLSADLKSLEAPYVHYCMKSDLLAIKSTLLDTISSSKLIEIDGKELRDMKSMFKQLDEHLGVKISYTPNGDDGLHFIV